MASDQESFYCQLHVLLWSLYLHQQVVLESSWPIDRNTYGVWCAPVSHYTILPARPCHGEMGLLTGGLFPGCFSTYFCWRRFVLFYKFFSFAKICFPKSLSPVSWTRVHSCQFSGWKPITEQCSNAINCDN